MNKDMHPEHLQIRRHAIAAILSSTTPIDQQSDLASQHRTRTHNAIVIAGAITGILGNIDSDLANRFAIALGISTACEQKESKAPLPMHLQYRKAKLDSAKAKLARLEEHLAQDAPTDRYGIATREYQQAQSKLLSLEIAQIERIQEKSKVPA